jgi:hypothetical protein
MTIIFVRVMTLSVPSPLVLRFSFSLTKQAIEKSATQHRPPTDATIHAKDFDHGRCGTGRQTLSGRQPKENKAYSKNLCCIQGTLYSNSWTR